MCRFFNSILGAGLFAVCLNVSSASADVMTVDTKLSLVIDVSDSINDDEYDLQMDGYAAAFRDTTVQSLILDGPLGKIAVNTVFFSSDPTTDNPFTLLSSETAINDFADELDDFARPGGLGVLTGIGDAIDQSVTDLLDDSVFESARLVMDVSGDGQRNTGREPSDARDDAADDGITINGLAIETTRFPNLRDYYASNVVTSDGFAFAVTGFNEFEDGIIRKLRIDVGGRVPEPGSMAIAAVLIATGGLFPVRRRRSRG